jgi:two-component system sensor histidine kinase YesM
MINKTREKLKNAVLNKNNYVGMLLALVLLNSLMVVLAALIFSSLEGTIKIIDLVVCILLVIYIDLIIYVKLFKYFQQSVGHITEENLAIRLSLKNARLSSMVSQLNPHFLFNTLQFLQDEIVNGTREVSSSILVSLANLFQYSLTNNDAFVKLNDEVKFVRDYLSICEHIYEGNLEVVIKIEDSLLQYMIPKFTLQPIVENCIKHGFSNIPYKNHIGITGIGNGNNILITVEDDGQGISPEKLMAIRSSILTADIDISGKEIGIKNVNNRIKLLFGKIYGVEVDSKESEGTVVRLTLPRIGNGKMPAD